MDGLLILEYVKGENIRALTSCGNRVESTYSVSKCTVFSVLRHQTGSNLFIMCQPFWSQATLLVPDYYNNYIPVKRHEASIKK